MTPEDKMLEQIRQCHAEALAEFKKENIDGIQQGVDDVLNKFNALEERVNNIAAANLVNGRSDEEAGKVKNFVNAVRYNRPQDVASETVAADGGLLVPAPVVTRIIQHSVGGNPIRDLATVVTISGDRYTALEESAGAGGAWVADNGTRNATDTPKLLNNTATAWECYAVATTTRALLEDAAFNVEDWLVSAAGRKFAQLENTAFATGNGSACPRGIWAYDTAAPFAAGKVEFVLSGAAAAFSADSLIDLRQSLDDVYQENATFLMSKATLSTALKLKAGTSGANLFQLWSPEYVDGKLESRLLGSRVRTCSAAPAVAANAMPIAYGDIAQAYTVVDRTGLRVVRDEVSQPGYIRFYVYKRVGGMIVNSEAVKVLKIATA